MKLALTEKPFGRIVGEMKTTTNPTLAEQLEIEAAKFGIEVEITTGEEVEITAPDGFQFGPELHSLVQSKWDRDTWPTVLRRAIEDVRGNGPILRKCPDDCPCKE